jgi:hypothetical protein
MIRAIRQLSLIAVGCIALAIWYAIRAMQLDIAAPGSEVPAGIVEYVLAFSLALGIVALLFSAVILGIIAALQRRQWGWLAAIAAFAVGTGAIIYDLAREDCIQGIAACSRGGFVTSAFTGLAPRGANLDFTQGTGAIISFCIAVLPLLILLLAYVFATEWAGRSEERQGRRAYIALSLVALLLVVAVIAFQIFVSVFPRDHPLALIFLFMLTIQPLMAIFTIVVAGSAGLSALRDQRRGWGSALLLVTLAGMITQLASLIGLINLLAALNETYYFEQVAVLGLIMLSLPATILIYALAGSHKAQPGPIRIAAQA